MAFRHLVILLLAAVVMSALVEGRYLPTRGGDDDRLDRLRDLIRDLLEGEVDKYNVNVPADNYAAERNFLYKRQPPAVRGPIVALADDIVKK